MSVRIINSDVLQGLSLLPDESVHCVVTSPPYWGLRDYGVPGQLGLEPTLGEHIDAMVAVFREVHRVLRKDGTLWLNYGDTYAASPNGRSAAATKKLGNDDRTFRDKPFGTVGPIFVAHCDPSRRGKSDINAAADHGGRVIAGGYLKPKDLCGVPWRLAIALQNDGWWLRQDIIWSKPNPMPESIKDRCTKAHEYLFLLTKSERYHFDAEAIAEDVVKTGTPGHLTPGKGSYQNVHHTPKKRATGNVYTAQAYNRPQSEPRGPKSNFGNYPTRNKRSVWTVATQPFPEAHFATFPPELIEPCIKAGCPEGGTVLDPFGGSGTTGLVADRLGRDAILLELNAEYAAMAERRISNDAPMFTEVEAS